MRKHLWWPKKNPEPLFIRIDYIDQRDGRNYASVSIVIPPETLMGLGQRAIRNTYRKSVLGGIKARCDVYQVYEVDEDA